MTRILPSHNRFLPMILGLGLLALVACGAEASPNSASPNTAGRLPAGGLTENGQPNTQSGAAPYSANLQGQQATGIHVSGQGIATAAPDLATINLGVEATADSVAEARGQAAAAMEDVISSLRDAGIAESDIQTTVFNISARHSNRKVTRCPEEMEVPPPPDSSAPMQEPAPTATPAPRTKECIVEREPVITGYQVTNQVSAKVRDLDSLSDIIDSTAAAGGDLVRFRHINFSIEDTSALEDQARSNAVADLQHRAQELSSLMGVSLGQPVFISEGSASIPPPIPYAVAERGFDAAAATPIQEGEISVRVTVRAAYNLE